MERHTTTSRTETERLPGIAEKLLRGKDFGGCRDFAILAQETEPLLEGSDQILAVAEVLVAVDNKRLTNNQPDGYSILQIPPSASSPTPGPSSPIRPGKSLYNTEFAARFTKVDLVAVDKQQHHFQQQKKGREAKSGQKLPVRGVGGPAPGMMQPQISRPPRISVPPMSYSQQPPPPPRLLSQPFQLLGRRPSLSISP